MTALSDRMLAIYSIAIFLCLASVAVGEAILRLCGYPARTQLAPAVGLAALIVLACAVFWLPGHRTTAGVIVLFVALGAVATLVRSRATPSGAGLAVALATLAAVSIPFLVNRHVGIFGVSIDDDFAAHFTWANSLDVHSPGAAVFPNYPLGPHELADSLAGLFGTSVEPPFTAILLALPVLVALTAQAVLREMSLLARVFGGLLVGLPYLVAAHLGEGSFKELMIGLLLLGFALTLRQLQRDSDWSLRRALVPGLMLAAVLLVYGRTGLVWPIAAGGLWILAESVRAKVAPSRRLIQRAGLFAGAIVLFAFLGSLSELARVLHFSGGVPGGNVTTDTSPFEVLGVWFSGDFRVAPSDAFQSGLLVGGALAVALYAVGWWTRRGDLAVPATAVASLIVYVVVRGRTGPYLTSKALVIASSPTMLTLAAPLLAGWSADARAAVSRIAAASVGLAFVVAALWSSGFALRYARVASDEHVDELGSLRALTKGEPTLDLMDDDFAFWELRGARLSSPSPYGSVSVIPFATRKPLPTHGTIDVDAIEPASLDGFRYVVTTRSQFASEMPPNWRTVASTRSFELWKREGTTRARSILDEGTSPGALLDCRAAAGRLLSRSGEVAGVWDIAPAGPTAAWTMNGVPLAPNAEGFVAALTGSTLTQVVTLPAGRWEISLAYQSPAHLYMTAADMRAIIPSNLNLLGPYWRVGELHSTGGPISVTLGLQGMRLAAAKQIAAVGGLVAVSLPRRVSVVPLGRACGRYVDWYAKRAPGADEGAQ